MKMVKTKLAKTALITSIIVIAILLLFYGREKIAPELKIENLSNPQSANTSEINIQNADHVTSVEHNQSLHMPDESDGIIEVSPKKEIGQGGPIKVHSGESGPEYPDADNIIQVEYQYASSETLNAPEVENLTETEPINHLGSNTDYIAELPKDEEPLAPRYESSDNIYPEPAPEMDAEEN
jgi:hypothetical protein